MKRGFTIVELLMVIGIISILMGIITTAVSSSIKSSREQKATSLCALVQAGLATYREQKGDWPATFSAQRSNDEGVDGKSDQETVELTGAEVRQCVKALVDETKNGNPLMDIAGLFVSRSDGELSGSSVKAAYGLDFMQAIRGTKRSQTKMKTAEMYFGYPDLKTGYFLRFKMVYSIPADIITVSKQR